MTEPHNETKVNAARVATGLITDEQPELSGDQMVERRIADNEARVLAERIAGKVAQQET